MRLRRVCCFIVLVFLTFLSRSFGGETIHSLEDVVKAWQLKEQYSDAMIIELESDVITPPILEEVYQLDVKQYKTRGLEAPPNVERTRTDVWNIKLSGTKRRIEHIEMVDGSVVNSQTSVFNEGNLKTFLPKSPKMIYPLGNIHLGKSDSLPQIINGNNAFMLYRPFATIPFASSNYTLSSSIDTIKTIPCMVLRPKFDGPSLWVSPDRGFSIVRYTLGSPVVREEGLIDYKKGADGVWVPEKWSIVRTSRGRIAQSAQVRVVQCQFGVKFSPAEFDFSFPAGTWVRDWTKTSELGDSEQYITRNGGKNRVVTGSEISASYEELVQSESGQAGRKEKNNGASPMTILLWGTCISMALICVATVFKSKKRK